MSRLSGDEIQRLAKRLVPAWELIETTPADSGELAVVHCVFDTPDGRRDCVMKANDLDSEWGIEREARVTTFLAGRTSAPVPEVHGVVDAPDETADDEGRATTDTGGNNRRDTTDLSVPAMVTDERPGEPLR
jgi:hypothetical protein